MKVVMCLFALIIPTSPESTFLTGIVQTCRELTVWLKWNSTVLFYFQNEIEGRYD